MGIVGFARIGLIAMAICAPIALASFMPLVSMVIVGVLAVIVFFLTGLSLFPALILIWAIASLSFVCFTLIKNADIRDLVFARV